MLFDGDIIEHEGLQFKVSIERDQDHGAPWEEEDGHGPVTDWEHRSKHPGELILNESRGAKRFYNFQEAIKIARRDGWNCWSNGEELVAAVMQDYNHLRAWCNDEWFYACVSVTLLDADGEETDIGGAIGGVSSEDDHYIENYIVPDLCRETLSAYAAEINALFPEDIAIEEEEHYVHG